MTSTGDAGIRRRRSANGPSLVTKTSATDAHAAMEATAQARRRTRTWTTCSFAESSLPNLSRSDKTPPSGLSIQRLAETLTAA